MVSVSLQACGLEAPEGRWQLQAERMPSCLTFNPDLKTSIAVAELRRGPAAGKYVIWNTHSTLFIFNSNLVEREPLRRVELRTSPPMSSVGTPHITCLAYAAANAVDEHDLLIGMSSGEAKVLSLAAQLTVVPNTLKPVSLLSYNADGNLTPSRCVALAWLPGSATGAFVSAHADGSVLLYQMIVGSSSDERLLASGDPNSRPPSAALLRPKSPTAGAAAAAVSPSGRHLALACRDGVLRVLELPSGALAGGFRSSYGGLLCCAWSHDGRFVAAGGEDDLVTVWQWGSGSGQRQIVAHLEGHSSWVSGVAFDAWESHAAAGRYRLATVGQDCRGMLWEVDLEAGEAAVAGQQQRHGNRGGGAAMRGGSDAEMITPALPRAEMTIEEPLASLRVHGEPLCDVCFTPHALLVSSHDGCVKRFLRPTPPPPQSLLEEEEDEEEAVNDFEEMAD